MKSQKFFGVAITLAAIVLSAGCARVSTQIVDKPRIDQETSGNAGYLKGSGTGPAPERKTTRQMFQADVELPTLQELNPWRATKKSAPMVETTPAPVSKPSQNWTTRKPADDDLSTEMSEQPAPSAQKVKAMKATTYTVKKGDTLEKIASKVYGKSSKWKKIYNANRDTLSSPNRVYVGQKLNIPDMESPAADSGDAQDFK